MVFSAGIRYDRFVAELQKIRVERTFAAMIWNFSFSLVTGIVLCIILGYYAVYPRLPIILNRYFVSLAVLEMLTLAFDILSSWMDMNHSSFPVWLLYAVNMLFFILFVTRSYGMYAYTIALVSTRGRAPQIYFRAGRILLVLFWLICLSSVVCGTVFFIDRDGYHSGTGYFLLYVQMFLFLIMGMYLVIRYRKVLSNVVFYGIVLAYAVLCAGGIFRYLFPAFLLMDMFYMIVVMILYITVENADLYRESRTMSFDFQAFEQVVREHHNYGIWYHLIGVMPYNYNETRQIYGGAQIDGMLSQVGRYLREMFPSGTVFYERSGCFLIMIEGREAASKAVCEILPEVKSRFRDPWLVDGTRIYMNFVFGQMNSDLEISSVSLELEGIRRLLEKGGNGELNQDFVVDREMISQIVREFAVKKALSDALLHNRIQVYMQPIVDAKTGRVIGAEALSRLQDPKLGLIPPSEFIPLAEHSGSIIQVGEQVLAKTCEFLKGHARELSCLEFININLSPIQCMDHDLSDTFDLVPKAYGIDPAKLHLEITEESMVDPEVLKKQMDVLGLLGYTFALDDYGSGYANQFRIKTFPFSGIKLDMKIVWAHFREPDAILPNAVHSFLDRGLTITAEGVENAQMAEGLTEMGCTYLQGYYFSRPLPMEEFLEYLRKAS